MAEAYKEVQELAPAIAGIARAAATGAGAAVANKVMNASKKKIKEQETDPVQKAQDKLDKVKKIADLKKQIDTINKADEQVNEDGHDDVPSSKRMAQVIIEDAQIILRELNKMDSEEKLDTWWTNKLAVSAHNMNAARDYIVNDIKEETIKEARWEIEGRVSYRGIGSEDSFHMVIDAPSKSAAERKVEKELDKARAKKKIGPGGGGSVDDFDIETIERTNDRLSPPETFRGMNSFNPALRKEETDLEEFTDAQIARLQKEYEPLKGKETGIALDKFDKLRQILKRLNKPQLLKLANAGIPIVSSAAKARLVIQFGMKWSQLPEELVPYADIDLNEQFKSVDNKVVDRVKQMMKGSREEKNSIANLMNYLMPKEVVNMLRDKLNIKQPIGKIKF